MYSLRVPITVAASHEPSSLSPNIGIVGSNPIRVMDACVRLFFLCGALCVGSGLAPSWHPVKRVLQAVYGLRNRKAAKVHKGCRAIDRYRYIYYLVWPRRYANLWQWTRPCFLLSQKSLASIKYSDYFTSVPMSHPVHHFMIFPFHSSLY
jgi:hypothetical protein